jgi:Anti-sigma factor NepR
VAVKVQRKKRVKSTKTGVPQALSQTDINAQNDPVGSRLRDFFSAIEDEGIPDRFLDLLEKLDAAEKSNTNPRKSSPDGDNRG